MTAVRRERLDSKLAALLASLRLLAACDPSKETKVGSVYLTPTPVAPARLALAGDRRPDAEPGS